MSALAAALAAEPAIAAFRCDSTTTLTLLGVDTGASRALYALAQSDGSAGWLLEADFPAGKARVWPAPNGAAPFGESTGPGAVLAGTRCGPKCLQIVRFRDGGWQPLGEPLLATESATLHLAWDRAGAPWVVLHALAGSSVSATAYRLEGGDWVSKGALSVRAVGNPGAVPAPVGEEGVTSGDGVFSAGGKPRRFVQALPKLAGAEHGQLVWLGGKAALHLGGDGLLRTTADGGATWEPLHWQPLSPGQGALAWRPGQDYRIELPDGERTAPAAAIWNDRRVVDKGQLFLATAATAADWRLLLSTPDGILTEGGERLPYSSVLRFGGERWVLLTGCVARQGGASLAIRRVAGGKLGAPELLKIAVP
ncbi:MAG TPA: hypothetical protein VGS57_04205 [Thermoanaerobaculia bacterium]|nr:hypothetical protein [Thermoanaerobaculia bacterium]